MVPSLHWFVSPTHTQGRQFLETNWSFKIGNQVGNLYYPLCPKTPFPQSHPQPYGRSLTGACFLSLSPFLGDSKNPPVKLNFPSLWEPTQPQPILPILVCSSKFLETCSTHDPNSHSWQESRSMSKKETHNTSHFIESVRASKTKKQKICSRKTRYQNWVSRSIPYPDI